MTHMPQKMYDFVRGQYDDGLETIRDNVYIRYQVLRYHFKKFECICEISSAEGDLKETVMG